MAAPSTNLPCDEGSLHAAARPNMPAIGAGGTVRAKTLANRATGRRPDRSGCGLKFRRVRQAMPFVPGCKPQTETVVIDAHIAILAQIDGLRNDRHDLLGHDADIKSVVPYVPIAIKANAIVKAGQQYNISLQANVGGDERTTSG